MYQLTRRTYQSLYILNQFFQKQIFRITQLASLGQLSESLQSAGGLLGEEKWEEWLQELLDWITNVIKKHLKLSFIQVCCSCFVVYFIRISQPVYFMLVFRTMAKQSNPKKNLRPKVALTPFPPTCFGHLWDNFLKSNIGKTYN